MQLNVGGNSTLNMPSARAAGVEEDLERTRSSMLDYDLGPGNVHVGPSDRAVADRPQVGYGSAEGRRSVTCR
jgi:hypothetical protein